MFTQEFVAKHLLPPAPEPPLLAPSFELTSPPSQGEKMAETQKKKPTPAIRNSGTYPGLRHQKLIEWSVVGQKSYGYRNESYKKLQEEMANIIFDLKDYQPETVAIISEIIVILSKTGRIQDPKYDDALQMVVNFNQLYDNFQDQESGKHELIQLVSDEIKANRSSLESSSDQCWQQVAELIIQAIRVVDTKTNSGITQEKHMTLSRFYRLVRILLSFNLKKKS